ncbi:hypothetical protein INR49_003154 [Caranx melampygus]|nr:hypothetical protein INR49_003154 [Caranx melampygus]
MSSSELQDTMRRLGSNSEDCSRLTAALSCLKSADETGGDLRTDSCRSEPQQDSEVQSPISATSSTGSPSTPLPPTSSRSPSISVSMAPCSDDRRAADETSDVFIMEPSPQINSKTRTSKSSQTPPQASRKLLQLLPNIALTRSKSQESQLANRIEEPGTHRAGKKNKVLAAIHINGNSFEDSALPSPLLSARTPGPVPASAPYMMPATPTLLDNVTMHRSSPQTMRRDIGLAVTHRFSTKSWLSQTCQVCHKSMMFGVKCKHCKLKCHNKCTKDAPSCRISFLTLPRMRRAESVPSDINNRIDHTAEIPLQYGTLPKAITKREPPISVTQVDSSSNPSSATSSTPSSPAHFQQSNPPSVSTTPPPNTPPRGSRVDNRFHFPDVPTASHTSVQQSSSYYESGRWKGPISRKASQTSVYLQEWDIPYEQLQLGELIGQGRWGKVHKGRWHGEVAIRLMEIDGNNQDHLKLFKKEVMNYRQTRHENVVLFMGACMAPPHLAIITSFCKGLTLYSVVRERGHMLDINKTRQIAQDIVKGMGYLHAKGIIHKDLKSKNIFYDTNKFPSVTSDFVCRVIFSTVWYELQVGGWPITNQPVEAKIWQVGSGEGIKKVLADANLGKEVTEILSACWSLEPDDRPTFTQLADMLEKLPKLNRRLSHPGHFWKTNEYVS